MFLLGAAGKAAGPGDCAKVAELMNLHRSACRDAARNVLSMAPTETLQAMSLHKKVAKEITMLAIATIS